ncbi:MAG: ferrous iron transport protein A [Chitinophagales bacterium]|jgi:Fe2+ transport system protein FeoA|nr:ferrous iron transport protein A [Chitinophagales bacterium]
MNHSLPLVDLPINTKAIIQEVLSSAFHLNLLELGFNKGKMLQIERKTIFGDPICIEMGSARIILRENEARTIIVKPCKY